MPESGTQAGYAPVNGLEMYYEIHGEDRGRPPVVLFHGSFLTIATWGGLLPALAETRRVIAVEQQGHGHTADIERPFSFEQMADDSAALLGHLGVEQVDVVGYSQGGGVGIQLAIRHPELVRKLVIVSAPMKSAGWHPDVLEGLAFQATPAFVEILSGTPLLGLYTSVAPNPDGFAGMVSKVGEFNSKPYDWTAEFERIAAPTLIVKGDADGLLLNHVGEMLRLLGGDVAGDTAGVPASRLAVVPGMTHVGLLQATDWLLACIPPFLDEAMPS